MTFFKKNWKWLTAIVVIIVAVAGYFGYQYWETKKLEEQIAAEKAAYQLELKKAIALQTLDYLNEEKEEVPENALTGMVISSHVTLRAQATETSLAKDQLRRDTSFSVLENDPESDYIKVSTEDKRQGYLKRDDVMTKRFKQSSGSGGGAFYFDFSSNPGKTSVDLSYYRSLYPGCVGYIYSPGTPISYPIMWTGDDYYLHHDYNKNESVYGAIYLAKENNSNFSDSNSILYGHHMKDGTMFASLSYYKNSSYYYSHPVMYLYTPSQNYRINIHVGLVVPGTSELFCLGFSESQWNTMLAKSTFNSGLGKPSGKTITLCTCSYEFSDARYIVVGELVPIS